MENSGVNIPPQSFETPRHLPSHAFSPFSQHHSNQATPGTSPYASHHHIDPGLHASLGHDAFHTSFAQPLQDAGAHQLQLDVTFASNGAPQQQDNPQHNLQAAHRQSLVSHGPKPPQAVQQRLQTSSSGPQFSILDAHPPQLPSPAFARNAVVERTQQENGHMEDRTSSGMDKRDGGHFLGMKSIPDAPNLARWRQKLFDVEGTIILTEDEFQTYFPHIDNVYSHRSTQKYKRKPFVSHYWDCRLKGRPPGTPKSSDPNKKKRKRQARERDLCDVKIKITEYFPGARAAMARLGDANDNAGDGGEGGYTTSGSLGLGLANNDGTLPGANGERYYTLSRVNGSNGNGRGDGMPGAHKHTLEESDRIKKNSIQRQFLKDEKERKKTQKTYHKKVTGAALQTVKRHSKDHELKIYGSCFCPFVQRVWISMEHKALQYQYVEVDPYKKPPSLLAHNPLGLVPAMQHGSFSCHESNVLLEYLEDVYPETALLPSTPQGRAHSRLWADHVNRKIIPAFYRTLQAQDTSAQASGAAELRDHIAKLVDAADGEGPFFTGSQIGWVDVQLAPWLLRLSRVLGPYRGWPAPEVGSRWARWIDAVEADESVKSTTSTDELYHDSYERYAENRPGTSQVADAVNNGRGLP